MFEKIENYFKSIFFLDLRFLGLFRIFLGLVSFFTLSRFWYNFDVFLGPRSLLGSPKIETYQQAVFSLFSWGFESYIISGIFIIGLFFNVLYIAGYKSRYAALLLWYLHASLMSRGHILFNGGDALLVVGFFWSIFLPVDKKISIQKEKDQVPNYYFSVFSVLFIIQILIVYLCAGISKVGDTWLKRNALYEVLQEGVYIPIEHHKLLSSLFLYFPRLSLIVVILEILLPVLFLIRFKNLSFRYVFIFFIMMFHLTTGFFMHLDLFPFVMISLVLSLCFVRTNPENIQGGLELKKFSHSFFAVLFLVIFMNSTLQASKLSIPHISRLIDVSVGNIGLFQSFTFFKSSKESVGYWVEAFAQKQTGEIVNIFNSNGQPPGNLVNYYGSDLMFKYMHFLYLKKRLRFSRAMIRYYCRKYNSENPNDLIKLVKVTHYVAKRLPDEKTDIRVQRFYERECKTK